VLVKTKEMKQISFSFNVDQSFFYRIRFLGPLALNEFTSNIAKDQMEIMLGFQI
jgi:hypothetical protein